jgi:hypothetical protein
VGRARFVLAAAVIALVACSCGGKGRPQATVRQFASVIDEQRPKIEPAWSGYQSVWTNVENHAPGVSLNAPCSGGVSNLVLGTEPFRTIADDFKRLGSPRPRFATLSRAPAPRHVSRQPCQPVREFTAVPRVAATLLAQPALVSRIPRVPRSGAASPVPCFLVSPRSATPGRTDHPEPATNRARAPNRLRRWTVQAQDGRCRRKWSVRRRWSPVRVALVQERSDGSVRLAPTLVQELAATMPRWARLVAPHAEAVAHLLGRAVRGQYQPRPPLTGGKLRGAQAVVRAREGLGQTSSRQRDVGSSRCPTSRWTHGAGRQLYGLRRSAHPGPTPPLRELPGEDPRSITSGTTPARPGHRRRARRPHRLAQ